MDDGDISGNTHKKRGRGAPRKNATESFAFVSNNGFEISSQQLENNQKIEERRAYNRRNAARARQRTKDQFQELHARLEEYAAQCSELERRCDRMAEENATLRDENLKLRQQQLLAGGAATSSASLNTNNVSLFGQQQQQRYQQPLFAQQSQDLFIQQQLHQNTQQQQLQPTWNQQLLQQRQDLHDASHMLLSQQLSSPYMNSGESKIQASAVATLAGGTDSNAHPEGLPSYGRGQPLPRAPLMQDHQLLTNAAQQDQSQGSYASLLALLGAQTQQQQQQQQLLFYNHSADGAYAGGVQSEGGGSNNNNAQDLLRVQQFMQHQPPQTSLKAESYSNEEDSDVSDDDNS